MKIKSNINIKLLIFWCWLFPLILGLSIFILWIAFRLSIFEKLGIISIGLGLALGIIGITLSLFQIIKFKRITVKNSIYILLTILNIPIALLTIYSVFLIETAYVVKIMNNSNYKIENCIIQGAGIEENIGLVDSYNTAKRYFWIKNDGQLSCNYKFKNNNYTVVIDQYVSNYSHGCKSIVIGDSSVNFIEY